LYYSYLFLTPQVDFSKNLLYHALKSLHTNHKKQRLIFPEDRKYKQAF